MTEFERILILRFSSGGDIVLLSPLLRCVRKRWPSAQIDMVVRSDFAELIADNPNLDGKLFLERGNKAFWEFLRKTRKAQYNLIIDAHHSLRSLLIRCFGGASNTVVINKSTIKRMLLIKFKLNFFPSPRTMIKRYFLPLGKHDVIDDGKGTQFHVGKDKENRIRDQLTQKGIDGMRLVGIAPSCSFPKKAYPLARLKWIADEILKMNNTGIILFGGKNEEKLEVTEANGRVLDLQGNAGLQESAWAAGLCKVVLTNDSLMLHLAEAMNTDVIALFGPTVKEFGYFPGRKASLVMETRAWCRPCTKNGKGGCIRRERYCLTRIDRQDILNRIKEAIDPNRSLAE